MTTFTASTDLPTNINTLERLASWVSLALVRTNPNLQVLESPSADPERVAQAFMIKADDGTTRLITRLSLEIDPEYAVNTTNKFWMNAKELSNTTLPAAFKTA